MVTFQSVQYHSGLVQFTAQHQNLKINEMSKEKQNPSSIKLHQHTTSSFQVAGNFHSRLNIKCHLNIITSWGQHRTYSYQVPPCSKIHEFLISRDLCRQIDLWRQKPHVACWHRV